MNASTAPTVPRQAEPSPPWHALDLAEVLERQGVDTTVGLTSAEAVTRRERYGENRLTAAAVEPGWRVFLRQYADPMQMSSMSPSSWSSGKGHIVAMTGDGVNDAPALKQADIGIAMGITGTEVSKEAAVMILTDDNFSTIVRAVEIGRALYDNLKKYIRFQMGVLLGFVVAFLGASILNVAEGVPFVPLQTLWTNFTVDIFLAVGLGYGAAAAGLMARPPRPADEAVLPRPLLVWLAVAGFVMGAVTLAVISWATEPHGLAMARTMGLTTFLLAHVFFAIATKDERRSIFNLDTLADKPLLVSIGASLVAIVLTSTLAPVQRLLQTGPLELEQWLVCIGASLTILVVSELRKLVIRRPIDEVEPDQHAIGEDVVLRHGS